MKIAIAADGKNVSEHFGHCEGFFLYVVEEKEVKTKSFIPNPGHKPGLLPKILHEEGTSIVISGGMGAGAIDLFSENNIKVITGASGLVEDVVSLLVAGNLQTNGTVCKEHKHADSCGGHH